MIPRTRQGTKGKPFQLTAPVPYELEIHIACAKALNALLLPPAEWICPGIGAVKLAPAEIARLSRIGVKSGWPDILVFWQRVWGIEIKRPGGQLSKSRLVKDRRGALKMIDGQSDVFPRLIGTGAFGGIVVCSTVEEMLHQLSRWGIPLRNWTGGTNAAETRT